MVLLGEMVSGAKDLGKIRDGQDIGACLLLSIEVRCPRCRSRSRCVDIVMHDAAIQDEGIQITRPAYWIQASDEQLQHAFRPDQQSKEEMPLLATRIKLLREAGQILYDVRLLCLT